MTNSKVKRAAIYARISKADSEVDKVDNQVKELKKLAKSSGYEVVAVFEDDDISAYKGKHLRPGWASLILGIEKRQFDVVMATEMSRFTRGSNAESDYFTASCVKAGAVIHTRSGGVVNPDSPSALAMVQVMNIMSGLEVSLKIERQKARNRADLAEGKPTKGLRPFGWEKDRITIRESEALHIRQAFSDILEKGESVWGIAQKWNRLGLKTDPMLRPRKSRADGEVKLPSGIWTTTTVRDLLRRPRNAGVLMAEGSEMPLSLIQPIVSRSDWEALCSKIKGTSTAKGPKPQYLLGGILECICGQRMHASKSNSGRPGKKHSYQIYRCRVYGFDKTSKHVTCQLAIADDVVRTWVVENIGLGVEQESLFNRDAVNDLDIQLAKLAESDTQLSRTISEGLGNPDQIRGLMRQNKADRERLEDERLSLLSVAAQSSALDEFKKLMKQLLEGKVDPDESEIDEVFEQGYKAWDELPMEARRSIIRGGYRVHLLEGGRGPDRIQVTSKGPLS
jgi:DNA invertase Pin-like site-specific DNA recombinase